MDFRTIIDIPKGFPALSHTDHIMLFGSCFAEQMGNRLLTAKFNVVSNPYGILYNPASISSVLREIMSEKTYHDDDLFCFNGIHHSAMHHGAFSDPSSTVVLDNINRQLTLARRQMRSVNRLMITFGTAYVYTQAKTGRVVSNCHKLPSTDFRRFKLSVEDIVEDYTALINELLQLSASGKAEPLQIIMTVSPIRHLKDGFTANQRSKATLLLAIEALQERFPQVVHYFPAYEIMMDDLRDYRFYASDLLHPSELAIDYLWECLSKACFSVTTWRMVTEFEQLHKSICHRPVFAQSAEYRRFLVQLMLKIEQLKEKYPTFDFEKDLKLCHTQLK